jgi:hypothetical protein
MTIQRSLQHVGTQDTGRRQTKQKTQQYAQTNVHNVKKT